MRCFQLPSHLADHNSIFSAISYCFSVIYEVINAKVFPFLFGGLNWQILLSKDSCSFCYWKGSSLICFCSRSYGDAFCMIDRFCKV